MGAYAYCEKCQAGFNRPTIFECTLGQVRCRCGHDQQLHDPRLDLAILLTELEERVTALEQRFAPPDE